MAPLSQGLSLYQSLFFEKEWMSGILEAFLYSSNPDLVRMMATESPPSRAACHIPEVHYGGQRSGQEPLF